MIREELQQIIFNAIGKEFKLAKEEIFLEHPENSDHGDYSTNVALILAKQLGKPPREVAEEIRSHILNTKYKILDTSIEKVEVAGPGFINFFFKKEFFLGELRQMVEQKEKYGSGKSKEKIIIEYSSPNIAKSFGIGHLRSTIIGQAIYNLYTFLGYKCIGINYPGDWGTPHGKILYQLYGKKLKGKTAKEQKKILNGLTIENLEKLYVDFHTELALNPAMEEGARAWFKKLEQNNAEARAIWEATRKISLREFERIYDLLNVKIDYTIGESFFSAKGEISPSRGGEDKMGQIVKEFKEKKLARESEGALIVPFPNDELPPAMLLKTDGVTTYFTRDLANMKYRMKRWKPSTIVIETGVEQTLHFKQVFLAARLAEIVDNEKLVHIAHGLYRSKEGKFSTRKGQTIHLEEVLSEAIERARTIIEESETTRGLSDKEKTEVARSVGIGGVKYNDLSQHPAGDIVFDWEKILNLKGNSGPYLQYTYARCKSIARKAGNSKFQIPNSKLQFSKEELDILRLAYRFPEVVKEAAEKFSPNVVATFVFEVAQAYNNFYNTHRVLQAEDKATKQSRLLLTAATAQIIKNSLSLLGIVAPERM
ncbi:MAG: arginyl-tRNA synthetase [Parcubacteria group bacterium Greene0714_21]|nr:MAG: arginyl-tRNA synthetase [Parcubacteria group bacterium Greene0714_21]